ncbi:MAG: hypothetical protein HYX42_04140 [Polaromonas sp.]|nr:hypothetical protein [Polaromonas sp.]
MSAPFKSNGCVRTPFSFERGQAPCQAPIPANQRMKAKRQGGVGVDESLFFDHAEIVNFFTQINNA